MNVLFFRLIAALYVCAILSFSAGCASLDDDSYDEHDVLPWNMPQSWEGSPSIPGLSQ